MLDAMISITRLGTELNAEDRNRFSVACKNITGAMRASSRILASIEAKYKGSDSDDIKLLRWATQFREKVDGEIKESCSKVLFVIENSIIPVTESDETQTFFYKMKGDYLRYITEVSTGEMRNKTADLALSAYKTALNVGNASLATTNPIRLGVALNVSVFYHEILDSPDKACQLAKQAFDEAIAELDGLTEDDYRDSTLIMQLLRDNLTLWTTNDGIED